VPLIEWVMTGADGAETKFRGKPNKVAIKIAEIRDLFFIYF